MSEKKWLPLIVGLVLLSMAGYEATSGGPNSYSITGVVSDHQKKPLSGVMITVYDSAEDKTVTVFTQAGGRFKLPGLMRRDYKMRARLPGFEDEFTSVPIKTTPPSVALVLKPAANLKSQETSVDRIRLIKWPNDEARLNFRMA